jgi:hypothetical protein
VSDVLKNERDAAAEREAVKVFKEQTMHRLKGLAEEE